MTDISVKKLKENAILPTYGSEFAAGAADSFGQFFRFQKTGGEVGGQHQLGDPLTGFDGLRLGAVVVETDHDLAPVVRVHHTHLIGRGQIALGGKAASGIDQTCPAKGDFHGKTGGDPRSRTGRHSHRLIQTGIQVRTRSFRTAVGGQNCVLMKFFNSNGTHFLNPFPSVCQSCQRTTSPLLKDSGTLISL